jgi:hypothetical protein
VGGEKQCVEVGDDDNNDGMLGDAMQGVEMLVAPDEVHGGDSAVDDDVEVVQDEAKDTAKDEMHGDEGDAQDAKDDEMEGDDRMQGDEMLSEMQMHVRGDVEKAVRCDEHGGGVEDDEDKGAGMLGDDEQGGEEVLGEDSGKDYGNVVQDCVKNDEIDVGKDELHGEGSGRDDGKDDMDCLSTMAVHLKKKGSDVKKDRGFQEFKHDNDNETCGVLWMVRLFEDIGSGLGMNTVSVREDVEFGLCGLKKEKRL